MPANRREPVSVPFWFQSIKCRPHGGLLQVRQANARLSPARARKIKEVILKVKGPVRGQPALS